MGRTMVRLLSGLLVFGLSREAVAVCTVNQLSLSDFTPRVADAVNGSGNTIHFSGTIESRCSTGTGATIDVIGLNRKGEVVHTGKLNIRMVPAGGKFFEFDDAVPYDPAIVDYRATVASTYDTMSGILTSGSAK